MTRFADAPVFLDGWDWDWNSNSKSRSWRSLSDEAKALNARIGTGGPFKDYIGRATNILRYFNFHDFSKSIESQAMVRAFLHAWISEPELAESTLRISTINALSASKHGISRLGAMTLIHLHLMYFDRVDQWESGLFRAIENAVKKAVASQKRNDEMADIVETVRARPELVIMASAASSASELVIKGEHSVEGLLADLKLSGFEARRYRELLNQEVYLRRIENADPNGNNSFLSDVSSDAVRKAPRPGGGYFGIDLLAALIFRPNGIPSLEWLNAILDIAGDPRMSYTQNWSTWWSPLDESARETVIRWLSDQDLELFLRTIEEYGERTNNETLQRMYPDRSKFLRGLQKSGLVRETRLFMPSSARNFAARTLPNRVLQTISRLEGTRDQSLIFIDCGRFHIVEGSHNFKIWVYEGAVHELLSSRRRYSTHIDELRQPLSDQYFKKGQRYKAVTHNGLWQYPVLCFLRQDLGIDINSSEMMTKATYSEMRYKKGMP